MSGESASRELRFGKWKKEMKMVWKMEFFLVRGNFNKFLVYFIAKTGERCEVATEPPESHGC